MAKARAVQQYHHGNLRSAFVAATVEAVEVSGPSLISLRDLARGVGVTHSAATHHFGDKAGLLTAVAIDGHALLADRLSAAMGTGAFLDVGVAYVRFAAECRGYFEVMFRSDLLHMSEELLAARARTWAVQREAARSVVDGSRAETDRAAIAAWAYAHGIATLWLDGNLPRRVADPTALAVKLLPLLFRPEVAARTTARRSPKTRSGQ